MTITSRFSLLLALVVAVATFTGTPSANAFAPSKLSTQTRTFSIDPVSVFKKKKEEDLSFIESRDMTREEMLELNKKNEEIMNAELGAMTGFSLILTLPILYLCWVAFFSD